MATIDKLESEGLIWREVVGIKDLMEEYPPRFIDNHKQWIYAQASPDIIPPSGSMTISRWKALPMPLPDEIMSPVSGETRVEVMKGFFKYSDGVPGRERVWHLNFADRNIFAYYEGPLFAQDESQVTEHPGLASIRHWLEARSLKDPGYHPNTRDAYGNPTPYLIQNIERRVSIATDPNPEQGRPRGLYGNRFRSGSKMAIEQATTIINPPTRSNIIAMAAIRARDGFYTRDQINFLFTTAYTGFMAARIESQGLKTTVTTGNWGCGAFGGNALLMGLIQLAAAFSAGIDELRYHPGNKESQFSRALDLFNGKFKSGITSVGIRQVLASINELGLEWGFSNGN
ncbi:MAG: hypothetical protein ACTSUE_23570 [Promethearchaeota archaeon]